MMVCGVDAGTRETRWCFLESERLDEPMFAYYSDPRSKVPPLERLRTMKLQTQRFTSAAAAQGILWIERPHGRFASVLIPQGQIMGAVACGLPPGWSYDEVAPQEWKVAIGLPGNAKKEAVQRWAERTARSGVTRNLELDEHSADAYAIAYTAATHGREQDGLG